MKMSWYAAEDGSSRGRVLHSGPAETSVGPGSGDVGRLRRRM